jgi:gentisate 1,2-dioxygenase
VFKIFHLNECATNPMEPNRGEQIKLINPALGTENVDVHLNRLVPDGPRGKVHHHTKTDNAYIVKRGEGTSTTTNTSCSLLCRATAGNRVPARSVCSERH